jgi:hypothetical protein
VQKANTNGHELIARAQPANRSCIENSVIALFDDVLHPGIRDTCEAAVQEDRERCSNILYACGYHEASEMLLSFNLSDAVLHARRAA